MNTGKTLFAQLMDFLPWTTFTRIVDRYGGDHRVRTLSCAEQYRSMAFAQLTYRASNITLAPPYLQAPRRGRPWCPQRSSIAASQAARSPTCQAPAATRPRSPVGNPSSKSGLGQRVKRRCVKTHQGRRRQIPIETGGGWSFRGCSSTVTSRRSGRASARIFMSLQPSGCRSLPVPQPGVSQTADWIARRLHDQPRVWRRHSGAILGDRQGEPR